MHQDYVTRRRGILDNLERVLSRHRGQQPASVIAINMPASSRYIPLTPDRELQEEGAQSRGFCQGWPSSTSSIACIVRALPTE